MRKVISIPLILLGVALTYGAAHAGYQMFVRHSGLFIAIGFFIPIVAWCFRPRAIGPFAQPTSHALRGAAAVVVAAIAMACNYHHLAFEHQIADAVRISYESEYNDDYDVVPFSRILVNIHTDSWWQTLLFYLFRVLVTLVELAIPFLTWQLMGAFVVSARPARLPWQPSAAPVEQNLPAIPHPAPAATSSAAPISKKQVNQKTGASRTVFSDDGGVTWNT